jgi:hypothetical protein
MNVHTAKMTYRASRMTMMTAIVWIVLNRFGRTAGIATKTGDGKVLNE